MALLIDSAPDCVTNVAGAEPADDSADFIIQAAYENCAGFMTFGPGSTYGEEGAAAATSYYILTWIGIIVTLAVLVAWVLYENRRLIAHALRITAAREAPPGPGPVPPRPLD
jgi:hypothetical protein